MFDLLLTPEFYLSLLTLTILEIILGIDNVVVIAVLVNKLPEKVRRKAQIIGLSAAMLVRILLLFTLAWLSHLIKPLFHIGDFAVTSRDIVLLIGGLFLIYKATVELIEFMNDSPDDEHEGERTYASFTSVIIQILIMDAVFSLDSVITAIGLAQHLTVMILAVVIAILFMMIFANFIVRVVDKYPSLKILALTFLIVVGIVLVVEGLHIHFDKSYLYAAMGFSLLVNILVLI
ncbi:TerC family protein, partial [Psittacicella gerlachiana]